MHLNRDLATLLLGGWLLMVPHRDPTAPLQTWRQEEAFDSVDACQQAKNEALSNLLRLKEASDRTTAERPAFKKSNEDLEKDINDYQNARCIPADHIYPPAKSAPNPGWYYITPPLVSVSGGKLPEEKDKFTINDKAPLAKWDNEAGFDTAQECEQAKREAQTKLFSVHLRGKPPYDLGSAAFMKGASGLCIATNDPRLLGKTKN